MRAISTNINRRCKTFFSASKRCSEWFLVEIRDVRILWRIHYCSYIARLASGETGFYNDNHEVFVAHLNLEFS